MIVGCYGLLIGCVMKVVLLSVVLCGFGGLVIGFCLICACLPNLLCGFTVLGVWLCILADVCCGYYIWLPDFVVCVVGYWLFACLFALLFRFLVC